MSNYAKVEVGVVVSVGSLPRSYMNISGFNTLDDVTLKEYGFYPVTIVVPDYDPLTEKLGDISYVVNTDDVTGTYAVVALDTEELAEKKAALVLTATTKLNNVMYNTDWVKLDDSGLSEPQETAYLNLRTDVIAVRTALDSYDITELSGLIDVLNAAEACNCSRFPDFSQQMTDVKDYLDSLLAE